MIRSAVDQFLSPTLIRNWNDTYVHDELNTVYSIVSKVSTKQIKRFRKTIILNHCNLANSLGRGCKLHVKEMKQWNFGMSSKPFVPITQMLMCMNKTVNSLCENMYRIQAIRVEETTEPAAIALGLPYSSSALAPSTWYFCVNTQRI